VIFEIEMTANDAQSRARPYIDGEWIDSEDRLTVTDLAEEGTYAEVAAATKADAERAIAAAHRATEAMAETTVVERAEWVRAIADELEARQAELAEVIVREGGKPIASARGEVDSAVERFRMAAEEGRSHFGEYREGMTKGHEGWQAIVKPVPVGTVLCIPPYNYPVSTAAQQIAPALVAGNTVVVKPSSHTPVTAAVLTEVILEATDLPEGAINYVPGRGSEIGDTLTGDERLEAIAMTGSSGAGEHIARNSGMVELHLELGGNAPAIIFPDANLEDAAGACTKGSVKLGGQRCTAVSRVLAHEDVHDELVDRIDTAMAGWQLGDLFEEDTSVGPLISAEQAEWVQELVDDAVEKGAEVVRGGTHDGPRYEPTVLANVPHDARIIHEEQFGPVAAVTTFESEDEAIEISTSSDLALDASVFTTDYDRAFRVAEALDTGSVRINGAPSHGIGDIPYGGNKDSGIGREGLYSTIEALTTTKSIIL
jgi:glyceraldehyde-3-phosphate dehydrogenase [NAD(P)+]